MRFQSAPNCGDARSAGRGWASGWRTRWASTKFADDISGEVFLDLAVPWNWLGLFGLRIVIPVVPAALPQHYATHFLKLFDQVPTLHATASSPTRRTMGNSPLVSVS